MKCPVFDEQHRLFFAHWAHCPDWGLDTLQLFSVPLALSFQSNGHFEEATSQGRGGRMGSLRSRPMVPQLLSGPPTHPSVYPSTQPTIHHLIHPLTCPLPTHPSFHPFVLSLPYPFFPSLINKPLLSTSFESTLYPCGDNHPHQSPGEQEDHIPLIPSISGH